MRKKRIYELAKELNISSKKIIDEASKRGVAVKNHMSTVDANQEKQIRQLFKKMVLQIEHKIVKAAIHR